MNLTPPAAHEEIISRILNAGKHAYTEKCFALDLATAKRMSALADAKGLYLGTAPDTFVTLTVPVALASYASALSVPFIV